MSAALVLLAVALLGALVGSGVPRIAGHFTDPAVVAAQRSGGPASLVGQRSPRGEIRSGPPAWLTALAGAVVFAGLAVRVGADPVLPALLLVAAVGLVLAVVDLACLRLPDRLVTAAGGAALAALTAAALLTGTPGRLLGAVVGAAVCFAAYVLLALLPGSRLGFGDVKLAGVLGLPLGWLGRPTLLLGLLLPHLLNGVVVLGLLATRRVRRDSTLPLGPALLAGAWLAVLFG